MDKKKISLTYRWLNSRWLKNKTFLPFYFLTLLPLCLSSCEFEASSNGDLDGFWQITQLDTLSTGGTTDMRERNAFWAVQHRFLEMKSPSGNAHRNVLFRFEHKGDSLILTDPYINNREESDIQVTDPAELEEFAGISQLRESFFVARLDGDKMDLQNKRFILHFRRY